MKALRQEVGLFAGLAVAAFIGGRFLGYQALFLGAAAGVYVGWHLANVYRLFNWLRRPQLKTPVSFGAWEWIFDRLQAINLRNRRRKKNLFGIVRRLRLVIGGLADAVVLLDDRGRVRWFNPAAKRLLGLKRPQAAKKTLVELLGHVPQIEQLGAARRQGAIDMPSPVNGAVILRMELSELTGTGQQLLIARDVTKTHNMERLRKDFVANVSHELRTPLTVFRGYLETLAEETAEIPGLAIPVTHLDHQAKRMQTLVEDLLDLSRVEFTERASLATPINVPELIETAVAEAKRLDIFDDHQLTSEIDYSLWLRGNAAIIQMVIANLIFNAVKHTGSGTRIDITWQRDDGEAVFRVADNGRGIAEDHLSRLTERFYRVDPAALAPAAEPDLDWRLPSTDLNGTGRTLQIASTPAKGSSFTCQFPAERVASAPMRNARDRSTAGKRETVSMP